MNTANIAVLTSANIGKITGEKWGKLRWFLKKGALEPVLQQEKATQEVENSLVGYKLRKEWVDVETEVEEQETSKNPEEHGTDTVSKIMRQREDCKPAARRNPYPMR